MFPDHFRYNIVADVGSMDINGNNRRLFRKCHYIGIDVMKGKNVDKVGPAHLVLPELLEELTTIQFNRYRRRIERKQRCFDMIISTEALEHDKYLPTTLTAMFYSLKPGGMLLITAAGEGRPEHGTTKVRPQDSPGTTDYYCNVDNEMFARILPPKLFTHYHLAQDPENNDLQFYGIKK
jgi:hypothetical protein